METLMEQRPTAVQRIINSRKEISDAMNETSQDNIGQRAARPWTHAERQEKIMLAKNRCENAQGTYEGCYACQGMPNLQPCYAPKDYST